MISRRTRPLLRVSDIKADAAFSPAFSLQSVQAGQIMVAAKLRFDKKSGQYEIESFGNQYIKATNVRPWN